MISAIIAEYNPFHNGHLKQIEYVKNVLKSDKIIVIMSGNFTQRGENAIMDKFTRAKHAVQAGADMVIELPTVFATANAEIFATGAVKILNDLNLIDELIFGVESGTAEEYFAAAKKMLTETKELKALIKEELNSGVSPVKARFNAIKRLGDGDLNEEIISSPNNILGLEYAKAVIKYDSKIRLHPVVRDGDHNNEELKKGITSATSIRKQLEVKKIAKLKTVMPKSVYDDLPETPYDFSKVIMSRLYTEDVKSIAEISDCTEGLENRIKALICDNVTLNNALEKITTKRYTYARVRRIMIANLLGIKEKIVLKALKEPLYVKILAVRESAKDLITEISENSSLPLLTRKKDYDSLKKTALAVNKIDGLANDIYSMVTERKQNEYQMIIVK